mgnify:FL=1
MPQTDSSNNWLVLYVRRNGEKKTAERLEHIGIRVYLPTVTVVRQWSDRKKKLQVPAVSGLLFVQLPVEEKNKVFDVVGPVRYLFMEGALAQVPDHEIDQMRDYLTGKGTIDQSQFRKGQEIYLAAFDATGVISKINAHHFWVQLPDSGLTVCLRAA